MTESEAATWASQLASCSHDSLADCGLCVLDGVDEEGNPIGKNALKAKNSEDKRLILLTWGTRLSETAPDAVVSMLRLSVTQLAVCPYADATASTPLRWMGNGKGVSAVNGNVF